jgi:ABC-type lipoprotein export system ATPase subunit
VRRLRQTTMMLVTHDPDLASLADSRLVLRDGRPVEQTESRIPNPESRMEVTR